MKLLKILRSSLIFFRAGDFFSLDSFEDEDSLDPPSLAAEFFEGLSFDPESLVPESFDDDSFESLELPAAPSDFFPSPEFGLAA